MFYLIYWYIDYDRGIFDHIIICPIAIRNSYDLWLSL